MNGYDWDVSIARAVCLAESGGNPNAQGYNTDGSNDAGLMQINSVHVQSGLVTDAGRFNPQENMRAAYAIYQDSGWSAWSAFNNGSYLSYM